MSTKIMSSPSNAVAESPSIGRNSSSTHTPVRHNYAASHTPIASAKRPRQPINRPISSNDGESPAVSTPSVSKSNTFTPSATVRQQEQQMSPMHPPRPVPVDAHGVTVPRYNTVSTSTETSSPNSTNSSSSASSLGSSSSWVGRKVDAIFSPVLNFLNGKNYLNTANIMLPEVDDDTKDNTLNSHTNDASVTMDGPSVLNSPIVACRIEPEPYNKSEIDPCDRTERISPEKVNAGSLDNSLSDTSFSLEEPESTSDVDDAEEQEDEFNPYLFIKSLPRYSLVVPNPSEKICLPPKANSDPRISLVLDLDETLVHCTVEPTTDADMIFPVNFHGIDYIVYVRLRPHLKEFLEAIRGKYEVIVFTASQQAYADELLNRIDPRE